MSENITVEIELKDQEAIVESLKEMGLQSISQTQTTITIAGRANGMYRDIVFQKNADGTYTVSMDSSDKRKMSANKLKQLYSKNKLKAAIKKKNTKYSLRSEKVDEKGNIKLKVSLRNV